MPDVGTLVCGRVSQRMNASLSGVYSGSLVGRCDIAGDEHAR